MVEYFQNKYSGESVARILGDGEDMSDEITQQGLLPGVKWVSTCTQRESCVLWLLRVWHLGAWNDICILSAL